jgi:hypothetical protein
MESVFFRLRWRAGWHVSQCAYDRTIGNKRHVATVGVRVSPNSVPSENRFDVLKSLRVPIPSRNPHDPVVFQEAPDSVVSALNDAMETVFFKGPLLGFPLLGVRVEIVGSLCAFAEVSCFDVVFRGLIDCKR